MVLAGWTAAGIMSAIVVFLLNEGLPALSRTGWQTFVFGPIWDPDRGLYGLAGPLIGTAWTVGGALVLILAPGLGLAVFLAEYGPGPVVKLVRWSLALLAGLPSVILGLFGLAVLVPVIREAAGGTGFSVLAASVVLAVMIFPTWAGLAEEALRSVPRAWRDGSLALGADRWKTVVLISLPAARWGLLSALILALGRALGETMAVLMVVGNSVASPASPFEPGRTLTTNLALEIAYAAGEHRQALFATGLVLLGISLVFNLSARLAAGRGDREPW